MKETLNLPQTQFPMKANLAQREPQFVDSWKEKKIYEQLMADNSRTETFVLNDGPPYANGPIHIGHSVNKILKDFIIKSQHLDGKRAPYQPGWDCHGLPIEVQIEKKFGRGKLSPEEFRQKCRLYAQEQKELQADGFRRLGILADWDNCYTTMQPRVESLIVKQLLSMVEQGAVSHGQKPVYWCASCHSALSEAETEFADKVSQALDVSFKTVENPYLFEDRFPTSIVIWTTTPWTLPANQAVAYSIDIAYIAIRLDEHVYILAEKLLDRCLQAWGKVAEDIVEQVPVSTQQLEQIEWLYHPLYSRTVPLITADHVTDESGTGFVHIAPDHGPEDFLVGKKYNLITLDLVDEYGRFRQGVPLLAGKNLIDAQKIIIEKLQDDQHLLACEDYTHSYPNCWRHKKPVFYKTTSQWFVRMTHKLKTRVKEQAKTVQWHPDWGYKRLEKMIDDRPDWCISRQRHWGTPLTIIYDKDTHQIHPLMADIGKKIIDAIAKDGIEAWFHSTLETWGVDNPDGRWKQCFDTLDVWFDSGSLFHLLEERTLPFPANLYLEGSDQYRGWFQSSLINSVAYRNEAPYKEILTHGMVVDAQGKKMSKSVGNVVSPQEVANKYGIDVLRLWIAMSDYREELAIGEEILERTADVYRRLRNTLRFLLGNLHDFNPDKDICELDKCALLDRYMLEKLALVQESVQKAYKQYRFDKVARTLIDFCVNDLGSLYLDIIKDRLYTSNSTSPARRSAQTTLYYIFESMVRQLAPIISFSAEDAWGHWPHTKESSVFLAKWFPVETLKDNLTDLERQAIEKALELKRELQTPLETMRRDGKIGSALEARCDLQVPQDHIFAKMQNELSFILLISQVSVEQSAGVTSPSWTLTSLSKEEKCTRCWFRVPLDGEKVCSRCRSNIESASEIRLYG